MYFSRADDKGDTSEAEYINILNNDDIDKLLLQESHNGDCGESHQVRYTVHKPKYDRTHTEIAVSLSEQMLINFKGAL